MLQRRDRALRELTSDEARARAEQHVSRLVAELERERDLSRTILHCDMDMFYAAVELSGGLNLLVHALPLDMAFC